MTVTSINQTNAFAGMTSPSAKDSTKLGQDDFLRLLTAQMQQQDPTNPVDNKEMLAQMAQFSSLSSLTEIGDTLKAIGNKLDAVLQAQQTANEEDADTPSTPTPPATTPTP